MKNMIFFLLLLVTVSGYSQVVDLSDFGLNLKTRTSTTPATIEGTPYLQENFEKGILQLEKKNPLHVFLRYDVSTEQIEIKTDLNIEDIYVLPAGQHAVYTIGSNTFKYGTVHYEGKKIQGYFVELFEGETYRLLIKYRTEISEAVKAKTSYHRDIPAEIKIEEDLYIVGKDGKAYKVRAKNRDLRDIFDSPEAKKYLSDNKVRSTEDLIKFLAFLDKQ